MLDLCRQRTLEFGRRLKESGIPLAVITDQSSIAYLAGFWGYLSIEFGRPTALIVRPDEEPVVVTPLMESEMVGRMTWISRIRTWTDSGPTRWQAMLKQELGASGANHRDRGGFRSGNVRSWLAETYPAARLPDVAGILGDMRMIKSPEEIEIMRQAGADRRAP